MASSGTTRAVCRNLLFCLGTTGWENNFTKLAKTRLFALISLNKLLMIEKLDV